MAFPPSLPPVANLIITTKEEEEEEEEEKNRKLQLKNKPNDSNETTIKISACHAEVVCYTGQMGSVNIISATFSFRHSPLPL
ncbi:hypothetical protein OUZ56_028647 [Daphnia magna]|uniref:Uncharacterized protein n=1 Tax=Daphnia magna TaxID=35525 RepID=A0ABR0B4I8_9CRUS|nr:hypothetical protein OUZ56_028647 [Daphnia magna]